MSQIAGATVGNPDLQRDFVGYYGPEARLNLMALLDGGNTNADHTTT